MLDKLGFVIHPDKSAFLPRQRIVVLCFTINSVDTTVTLTEEKILKIETLILHVLNSEKRLPSERSLVLLAILSPAYQQSDMVLFITGR